MNYPNELITIDDFSEFSFKEKGSMFTAQVFHCESEDEAGKIIASVKKNYYDATHHCYAYKLLKGDFKYSDDGEPNGTAGVRILNAINHFGLLNILVIVIRIYGGVNLGAGPLGKAYYTAANEVLGKSKKIKKILHELIKIESSFEHISHVHRIISNHNAIIAKVEYGERAMFECMIKPSDLESISNQLNDLSKGEIKIISSESKHYI